MIQIGPLKLRRQLYLTILALLLILLIVVAGMVVFLTMHSNTAITPTPLKTVEPSQPGTPVLQTLGQVTDQAFGVEDENVPNSWGVQKNRIVRMSTGDLFTVYTSPGRDNQDRNWHLMHLAPGSSSWVQVASGDAGVEPINILRGPHDALHVFAWPGIDGKAIHLVSTDMGKTFSGEEIPGQWTHDQGYSSSGIDELGDMVFFQSGNDQPGEFLWAYYSHTTQQWQFHITKFDFRYTYAFFFPGDNNDLSIVAMRDVQRDEIGLSPAPPDQFNYVFNAIRYFHIGDVNNPDKTLTTVQAVAPIQPQSVQDYAVTYLTDAYIDTQGRTHILYYNSHDDMTHHIVIDNGQVTKDVTLNINFGPKARIIQDAQGHFYIIATSHDGNALDVYPGTASDTDGTQLNPPVALDISQLPGCSDYDYCHAPTIAQPRSGTPLSNTLDGTYGNHNQEIYFRIQIQRSASSLPAPVQASITTTSLALTARIIDDKKAYDALA